MSLGVSAHKREVFLVFLSVMFCSVSSQAQKQKGIVEGYVWYVVADSMVAAPSVHVEVSGTNLGTTTNENGFFSIGGIPPGRHVVMAYAIGYKTEKSDITIEPNTITYMEFRLTERVYSMPQIEVLSGRDRLFDRVPGSVAFVSAKQIEYTAPINGNEVFRRIPGIHVVDEEGVGLRANIGVRGLDPDRSRTVLILEDGIPVAIAPYGEPEMYYTPSMDRMSGVEIIKGSGSILFGPQTMGGVINYITADPPDESRGSLKLRFGEGGYFTGMASYGTSYGNSGIHLNYLRKSANNLGNLLYRINDFSFKIKIRLSNRSLLGIKTGIYDEGSNSTYVGLTQRMYDMGGMDFVRLAPDDLFRVKRYSISATHEYRFSEHLKLKTTAFGYSTTRNWRRQEYSLSASGVKTPTGVVWGDTTVAEGAIYMDNRAANRNRRFDVAGLEPRLTWSYRLGTLNNELDAGARILYEHADEKLIVGEKKDAASGVIRGDEIRNGYAASAYLQQRVQFSRAFSMTAGVRTEYFHFHRHILRGNFVIQGQQMLRDTSLISASDVVAIIPGIGFNYRIQHTFCFFGGLHRGFAPPRIKDALSSTGEVMQLKGEYSWNYELGIRSTPFEGLKWEITGFYMDFSNQVIPVSQSSGGSGSGLVNGGRTLHTGIEAGLSIDVGKLVGSRYIYRLDANATYVYAVFNADRFITNQHTNETINVKGNSTPYAPPFRWSAVALVETPLGLSSQLTALYISSQFTDALNTVIPPPDGRTGRMPAYFLLDGLIRYAVPKINLAVHVAVKNIFNERYIASRRPQGIRVGLPRFFSMGIDFTF